MEGGLKEVRFSGFGPFVQQTFQKWQLNEGKNAKIEKSTVSILGDYNVEMKIIYTEKE